MTSKDYWMQRAVKEKQAAIDTEDAYAQQLEADYARLKKSVSDELAQFYGRYADSQGMSMQEARKLLTDAEREDFRLSLDEFRAMAEAGGYEKELDEIYLRSRISRLQALQTQLEYLTQQAFEKQHDSLQSNLGAVYTDTYYQRIYDIQSINGMYNTSFAVIDDTALQKVLNTPWLGDNFSGRIWNNRALLVNELQRELSQAFVRGDSLDKVSRRIAKRMDVAQSRAETLVRTEFGHIAEQAALDSYDECETEEYDYLATLDSKTCAICAPLDGRRFKVSQAEVGINYPLMHPRCRCTTVPAVDEELMPAERAARNPNTGKSERVPNMTYEEWKRQYADEREISIPGNSQEYRKVEHGESLDFKLERRGVECTFAAKRIKGYNTPVYVSDNANIKPKALHEINRNTENALRQWGISPERKPTIVILSDEELNGALGLYDACENVVYYTQGIAKKAVQDMSGGFGAVEYHEMWHMRQAENFRKSGWKITKENRGEYINALCKKCKKSVDRLGITEDNVDKISEYAYRMYRAGRYDEVEAEYKALRERKV